MTGFEVLQVRYGERVTQKSAVLHDYASYGEPDGDLPMDYNFWVLRDGQSTILVDTGYDIGEKDWLGEQPVIPTPDALRLLDVDPATVSMVVTSHFHYDHIGHLGLFAGAQIVAGAAEYEYWRTKWRDGQLAGEFATVEHLEVVWQAELEGRLRLVDGETEVHPGVTVHPVGGHTPGELVTLVRGRSGPLLLAADAAHFYEQVENEWPFFAFTDLDQMRAALSYLNELATNTGATIIPGHDGRTRDRFPPLAGPASAVTTVLG